MTRTAYITTAAYAGQLSSERTEHADRAAAFAAVLAFHRAGFHYASIMGYDGRGKYTRQGDVHTRAPRVDDRIVGEDTTNGERVTGTVTGQLSADNPRFGFRAEYVITDVHSGYGDGPSVEGDRIVHFEQYDAAAVPGIHYDPAALNLDLRPRLPLWVTTSAYNPATRGWEVIERESIDVLAGLPLEETELTAEDFGGVKGATYLVEIRNADDQVIKAIEVVAG